MRKEKWRIVEKDSVKKEIKGGDAGESRL